MELRIPIVKDLFDKGRLTRKNAHTFQYNLIENKGFRVDRCFTTEEQICRFFFGFVPKVRDEDTFDDSAKIMLKELTKKECFEEDFGDGEGEGERALEIVRDVEGESDIFTKYEIFDTIHRCNDARRTSDPLPIGLHRPLGSVLRKFLLRRDANDIFDIAREEFPKASIISEMQRAASLAIITTPNVDAFIEEVQRKINEGPMATYELQEHQRWLLVFRFFQHELRNLLPRPFELISFSVARVYLEPLMVTDSKTIDRWIQRMFNRVWSPTTSFETTHSSTSSFVVDLAYLCDQRARDGMDSIRRSFMNAFFCDKSKTITNENQDMAYDIISSGIINKKKIEQVIGHAIDFKYNSHRLIFASAFALAWSEIHGVPPYDR